MSSSSHAFSGTGSSSNDDGGASDVVELLIKACTDDLVPDDAECIQVFMFDRCLDRSRLLGLYQGMFIISDMMYDKHYKDVGRGVLQQAVQSGRLVECLVEEYEAFHQEFSYGGSGYWKWFMENLNHFRAVG